MSYWCSRRDNGDGEGLKALDFPISLNPELTDVALVVFKICTNFL